ncbi:hypothetical protein HanRHA438_Chr16g0784391 [Helianthus annuus]|nr:hypothetical protein HanIR_Chr16g0839861 [Helianthus annuus]KAJ0838013.1 hypothetical protein HanRHA438_Chr16g0784391 [Helianthus annuus]
MSTISDFEWRLKKLASIAASLSSASTCLMFVTASRPRKRCTATSYAFAASSSSLNVPNHTCKKELVGA